MLPFFRKIRWRLAQDNQFLKYSRYAIGEIVLVVIGILIALQINNWNEEKILIIKEEELLQDLKEDLESNIRLSENKTSMLAIKSCEIILDVVKKGKPYNDSLTIHFHQSRLFGDLNFTAAAYEALKNKGLDLIRSKSLRKKIIQLFEINLKTMQDRLLRIEEINSASFQVFMYENFESDLNDRGKLLPNDLRNLLHNQLYINLVTQRRNFQKMNMEMTLSFGRECQELLNLINIELNK